jgi:outer membrane protein
MKKSMMFAALLLTGFGFAVNAQAQKIAHINTSELVMAMPETKKAQERLQKVQDSLNTAYGEMIQEYKEKDSIIRTDSAKWTPAKKDIKFKEFQDLSEALQNYSNSAQQYLQQKEQELLEPVQKIAREAIQKVAKDNGYAYVINAEMLIVAPPSDDLLAKVKAYLKIADKPAGGK